MSPNRPRSTESVLVGRITRTHGVNGEVYVSSESDNPDRFAPGRRFRTSLSDYPTLVIADVRSGPHGLIVAFAGVTTVETANELRGASLMIDAANRRRLDEGEFWPDQLVGLEVHDGQGRIGVVEEVVVGSQDRLVIACDDGSAGEVPFVNELVPEVDLQLGRVTVSVPDGLFSRR